MMDVSKSKQVSALINPKALSSFLKLGLGDGMEIAGFVDGKAGRILGWEDVDEKRGQSELCWLVTSAAAEGISTVKGNRVGCVNILQGRFTLLLVSLGSSCHLKTMEVKLEEMKRVLELQYQSVVAGKGEGGADEAQGQI